MEFAGYEVFVSFLPPPAVLFSPIVILTDLDRLVSPLSRCHHVSFTER
jgi:hypothetical protein